MLVRFDRTGILRLPKRSQPLIMVGPGTGVAPFRALMEERRRVGARGTLEILLRAHLALELTCARCDRNVAENLLFFGCRSITQDFYFEREWDQMVQDRSLALSVAASRDQVSDPSLVDHVVRRFETLTLLPTSSVVRKGREGLRTTSYSRVCSHDLGLPRARRVPLRLWVSARCLVAVSIRPLLTRAYRSSTNMPKAVKKAVLLVFSSQGGLAEDAAQLLWDRLEKEGRIVEETWG